MDFKSAVRAPPFSSENYGKVDLFDKDHASELIQISGACRMDVETHPESLNSSSQHEEISKILNGPNFARTFKDLLNEKKEAEELRKKLKQSEKEKADLQLKFDVLKAENYQSIHFKTQQDGIIQKINELQTDLSAKVKAQQKLKKEAKDCCVQLSEKSKTIKKIQKDKKRLWNMLKRFAHKLDNADLLTLKEKNIIKKSEEQDALDSEDTFDSEDHKEPNTYNKNFSIQ